MIIDLTYPIDENMFKYNSDPDPKVEMRKAIVEESYEDRSCSAGGMALRVFFSRHILPLESVVNLGELRDRCKENFAKYIKFSKRTQRTSSLIHSTFSKLKCLKERNLAVKSCCKFRKLIYSNFSKGNSFTLYSVPLNYKGDDAAQVRAFAVLENGDNL